MIILSMDGYLLVDKPRGLTSHDVVARVRRILRTAHSTQPIADSQNQLNTKSYELRARAPKPKVGHTGTLDPLASGLMILVLGSYTKRAQEFSKMDKTYEAVITLGATSATGDGEGPIIAISNKQIAKSEVEKALKSFVGEIMQTPHAHSAVKVGGQRAYKLARAGKDFKIEPRKVTIYELQSTNYGYPKLCITARVSSGTYIRSLAEDIGQKLGTGAYVSALRRTKVGQFDIKEAQGLENLNISKLQTGVVKE
ncbi:MAG: tRNA pseudouridine(55) synthase TruB [bacterium]|nr:tRNA pseudouridine(55) synthase TruB [bacterium]